MECRKQRAGEDLLDGSFNTSRKEYGEELQKKAGGGHCLVGRWGMEVVKQAGREAGRK